MKSWICLIVLLLPILSQADIYKCQANGKVVYKPKFEEGCEAKEFKDTLSSPQELERQRQERERKVAEEQKQAEAKAEQAKKQAETAETRKLILLQKKQLELQRQQLKAAEESAKPYWITPFYDERKNPPPGFRSFPEPPQ